MRKNVCSLACQILKLFFMFMSEINFWLLIREPCSLFRFHFLFFTQHSSVFVRQFSTIFTVIITPPMSLFLLLSMPTPIRQKRREILNKKSNKNSTKKKNNVTLVTRHPKLTIPFTQIRISEKSGKKMTGCYSPWRLVANKLGVVSTHAR